MHTKVYIQKHNKTSTQHQIKNSVDIEEAKLFHMLALINVGLSYALISYFEPTAAKALRFKSDRVM